MPCSGGIPKFPLETPYPSAGVRSICIVDCLCYHFSWWTYLCMFFIVCAKFNFRFIPPDNFNLALLTLEIEFVKGKVTRNEQVISPPVLCCCLKYWWIVHDRPFPCSWMPLFLPNKFGKDLLIRYDKTTLDICYYICTFNAAFKFSIFANYGCSTLFVIWATC